MTLRASIEGPGAVIEVGDDYVVRGDSALVPALQDELDYYVDMHQSPADGEPLLALMDYIVRIGGEIIEEPQSDEGVVY